jgi:hypothetical protein
LGSFCEIGARGGGEVVFNVPALEAAPAVTGEVGGADNSLHVANAEIGEIGSFGQDLVAKKAFRLEAAEFGGRLVKKTAGLGAGAIDGELAAAGGVIIEGGEGGFDEAAAAKTPHGSENFLDQVLFQEGSGAEFGVEGLFVHAIDGIFAGADEGAGGEEAGGEGVLRGGGLSCFGDRAGG